MLWTHREAGCHWLLVGFRRVYATHLFNYAVQVKNDCHIRNLDAIRQAHQKFGCCPPLLPLQGLIIHNLWAVTAEFITNGQISRHELLEQLHGGALAHSIIPKEASRIQKFDAAADNPNELLRHCYVSSPLLELWLICVHNSPALVTSNVPVNTPPLSWHVTPLFPYHWSLLPTRCKKWQIIFLIYIKVYVSSKTNSIVFDENITCL